MIQKPILFPLPPDLSLSSIQNAFTCEVKDTYHYWLEELSELEQTDCSKYNHPYHGNWAYFPWRKELIHIPEPHEFRKIFFSRNYPLIDPNTQNKLWNMQIAIAGLSVGSNIAIELAKAGIHRFKIADFDTLAPSNNNRITGGSIFQIGENKAELLAKKLYELNPYCEIEQFPEGLTTDNFDQFVQGCDIIIDEIDAFLLKNKLRDYIHSEKGKNTILLQGADLGETPIVEIETYSDPKFGGRIHELDIHNILSNNPSKLEATRMLVSIVGRENIPAPFLQNFINIKKDKQSYWAQLGLAATAVGAKMTSMVIEIARGNASKLNRITRLQLRQIEDEEEKTINTAFDHEFSYRPPIIKTIFSSDEAPLSIIREFGERNTLNLTLGGLTLAIHDIPGNKLTNEEMDIIHKARHSYSMWGDDLSFLMDDPSDKKWEEGLWETRHQIAWIKGPNNFKKIYALRKSYISYEQLQKLAQQDKLLLEFAPWKVTNERTGITQSLWDVFTNNVTTQSLNIAVATRFCTITERQNDSELEKEAAAITFAAMQLFYSDTQPAEFIFNIITKSSLRKIFSVKHAKKYTSLAFDKPCDTFKLTSSWKTILDTNNPIYMFYATKVPKYFAQEPMIYITKADKWRQSALNLLKEANAKYG